MKFLIVLAVVVFVTVKSIFGFFDIAAETVYEGNHKTDQVLNDLDL